MTVKYDPVVIQQFANALYSQARTILLTYALLGALIMGGTAFAVIVATGSSDGMIALGAAILGCLIGSFIGNAKGAELRLQAQLALCQLQVEINTRRD